MRSISASDANRQFSALLRDVANGEYVTVVSRGKPVALLSPIQPSEGERSAARQRLLARLRNRTVSGERNWSRDELYDP